MNPVQRMTALPQSEVSQPAVRAMIEKIRRNRRRSRLWDRLTMPQRHEFIMSLEGDDWHLDDLLEEFVELCGSDK